jgi:hypothetical protein
MAANVGTSGFALPTEPGDTMWQPLHTRCDNSWPRFASARPICAAAEPIPETTQIPEIASTFVSRILVLIIDGSSKGNGGIHNLAADEYGQGAESQDFQGSTAKKDTANGAASMQSHDEEIIISILPP